MSSPWSCPLDRSSLEADPVRLAQVVGNLLTNAAKYTEPDGRIGLTVEQEGGEAVLRVRDTGIGIAPEMLPRVFDLFVQADHADSRSQGGLGIGLTLVRNLVEMHGGTVEARSDGLAKGTEFVVRLPLGTAEADEPGRHRRKMASRRGGAACGASCPGGRRQPRRRREPGDLAAPAGPRRPREATTASRRWPR